MCFSSSYVGGPVVVHLWKGEKAYAIGIALLLIGQSVAAAIGYIAYINWQSDIPYRWRRHEEREGALCLPRMVNRRISSECCLA